MHLFFGYGVYETDLCGMKHQAVTLLRAVAVQSVAEDRCVQTLRVRRMNSQLMRRTRRV